TYVAAWAGVATANPAMVTANDRTVTGTNRRMHHMVSGSRSVARCRCARRNTISPDGFLCRGRGVRRRGPVRGGLRIGLVGTGRDARIAPALAAQRPDLDPAHLPAVLPGGGEAHRRLAPLDRAPGVALELVAAAQAQVTRDGQEPRGDALGTRTRVPDVLDGRVVRLAHGQHPRLTGFEDARTDLPAHGVDLLGYLDHGVLPWRGSSAAPRRRARLPRASSVASA